MITVADLDRAVGALLRQWSYAESALNTGLEDLEIKPQHGIKGRLQDWFIAVSKDTGACSENLTFLKDAERGMLQLLEVRNRLCHGMIAASGDLDADPRKACIRTMLNGKTREMSIEYMQHCAEFLEWAAHFLFRECGAVGDSMVWSDECVSLRSRTLIDDLIAKSGVCQD